MISRKNVFTELVSFLAVAVILCTSVSCSSKQEDAIAGKWSKIGDTEKMEFFKDGTITIATKSENLVGKYSFIDKDRIRVELGGVRALGGPFVASVSFSGDELTWTMPDGTAYIYTRE
ncbi:MAG: hypothetical protein KBA51_01305 [Kiritimatiellae bacterium]|nr:hypothetical protein [Kiritimatiellia bacterium]